MNNGSLEVICGSMFSGKTEELLRRLRRAEYAKQKVLTIKHHIDDRTSFTCISSHTGQKREATPIEHTAQSFDKILEMAQKDVSVIGIDEVQFFPKEIINVICSLIDMGKRVVVSGLDLDFRGEPFGVVPILMAIADNVTKLKAICVRCGKEAYNTQRLINGEPAKYNDPTIMVGASEFYEARCRNCFAIDMKPEVVMSQSQLG